MIGCKVRTRTTHFTMDSIDMDFSNMDMNLLLKPLDTTANVEYRHLTAEQTLDYFVETFTDTTLTQDSDMMQVMLDRWKIGMDFNINGVVANMGMLNYPVNLPVLKMALDGDDLKLKNFIVSAKNSDMQLSGTINDLAKALVGKEKFKGELALKSNNLNINELMNVVVVTESATDSLETMVDTVVPMSVIEVPNNIKRYSWIN